MMQRIMIQLMLVLFCSLTNFTASAESLADRAEVQSFIQHMREKHHFPEAELQQWFSNAHFQPQIIEIMQRPYEAKPWHQYRELFVTEDRTQAGVDFWKKHAQDLQRAEATYGVPPEIVVAIIGVETRYGKHQGTYKVMESLSSLAFAYPPRADFFKSELEQYLLLCREQQFNPLELKGSYAGAMGLPQFISSSYRHYAVDFAGHGHADLLTSPTDAIGSVANYFKMHGWKKNQPVVFHAAVLGKDYSLLLADRNNPKPTHPASTLQHYGISFKERLPEGSLVALIELEQPYKPEYWLALDNFYVITRYNHSSLYAMAVYQLSEKIKQRYHSRK